MQAFIPIVITIICWAVFFISFSYDRSRYRNCPLLFMAFMSLAPAVYALAGERGFLLAAVTSGLIILAFLAVPVILIANGIIMYKREGHALGNLLSLIIGLMLGAGEIVTIGFVIELALMGRGYSIPKALVEASPMMVIIIISVLYFSASLLMFVLYCLFLMIVPRKSDFDYVIIHGAGLLGGEKVSKLLSDRIDKAIDVYRKDPSPTILIPSGGQGADEKISEAEAMAIYMKGHGIPESDILPEDRSATTYENLENSKALIDSRGGRKYTALVTSNYHVYRALRYCRKIGLKCTGIGSHVALYYWPSAVIREYLAIHAEKKHMFYFIAGWLLCILPVIAIALHTG